MDPFLKLVFKTRQEVCIFNILWYQFPYFCSIGKNVCIIGPLCMQHITEQSPLQILEKKYGNRYCKILKMQTSCLASKRGLRNQCHKIARVDFVRRVTHKTFVARGTWGLRVKRRVKAPQTVPKENLLVIF